MNPQTGNIEPVIGMPDIELLKSFCYGKRNCLFEQQ